MIITTWHVIGIFITLALIIGVGFYSGVKVKDAKDFTTGGGKATALLVCGSILGSLVSGQATIGTAQLAYSFGMSAWWFTLGSGIGCLILGILYVIPLRESGNVTLMEVISKEYGQKAEYVGSILCSIGIFISVIAQVLSACALLTTIFPISFFMAALISIILMIIYVVFGGAWGAGMGGVLKLFLLYLASVVGCGIVLISTNGFAGLMDSVNQTLLGSGIGPALGIDSIEAIHHTYLNMFARGTMKDLGSAISLLLGVLSTQTYAQAIWSGKSHSAARKGAFLSACLIPPIGIACIMIGLFMRGHCITSDEIAVLNRLGETVPSSMIELSSTAQVFPAFIVNFMPDLFGGIVLGTLLITVVGGGAGLSLGVATILVNDIFLKVFKGIDTAAKKLVVIRVTICFVLGAAMMIATVVPGAVINDFGFLSMGLRGTVVFLPMTAALFLKGKISSSWAMASIIAGPIAVLVGKFAALPIDALFPGVGISFVCLAGGYLFRDKKSE